MERIFEECVCVGLIYSVHTLFLGISVECVCDDSQTTVTIPAWPTRCVVQLSVSYLIQQDIPCFVILTDNVLQICKMSSRTNILGQVSTLLSYFFYKFIFLFGYRIHTFLYPFNYFVTLLYKVILMQSIISKGILSSKLCMD